MNVNKQDAACGEIKETITAIAIMIRTVTIATCSELRLSTPVLNTASTQIIIDIKEI